MCLFLSLRLLSFMTFNSESPYSRGLKLKTMYGLHWEGKCLRGPQIKLKNALRATLWRPNWRDAKLIPIWLNLNSNLDIKIRKNTQKICKYFHKSVLCHFLKEVASRISTSRGPRVWDRCPGVKHITMKLGYNELGYEHSVITKKKFSPKWPFFT